MAIAPKSEGVDACASLLAGLGLVPRGRSVAAHARPGDVGVRRGRHHSKTARACAGRAARIARVVGEAACVVLRGRELEPGGVPRRAAVVLDDPGREAMPERELSDEPNVDPAVPHRRLVWKAGDGTGSGGDREGRERAGRGGER